MRIASDGEKIGAHAQTVCTEKLGPWNEANMSIARSGLVRVYIYD